MSVSSPKDDAPPRWRACDAASALFCALVGLYLAVSPHLAMLARYGTPVYFSDFDDLVYLTMARAPYYGESTWRDGYVGWWERVPCIYSWIQFAPFAHLAQTLGLPLVLTSLVWRALGGPLMGLALYVLFRRLCRAAASPCAWALGCALICLSDRGFMGIVYEKFLVDSADFLRHMITSTPPSPWATSMMQYRVVSPLLSAPFFLLLVASLLPPGPRGWRDIALGAVGLALCILTYFYYWTAAVLGIGGYLFHLVVRYALQPNRDGANLARARAMLLILALGLGLGAYSIIINYRIFADPHYRVILHRMLKSYVIPARDPLRWSQLGNRWYLAKLGIGTVGVLALRAPGLGLVWWMAVVGFALRNSGMVTGLEFENNHWAFVTSPMTEVLLLGTAVHALDRWAGAAPVARRGWLNALWLMPVAMVAIACAWRPYEATHAEEPAKFHHLFEEFRPFAADLADLGRDATLAGPNDVNVALMVSRSAILYDYPYIWIVSAIPDEELHQRHALNGWLRGLDRAEYEVTAGVEGQYFPLFQQPQWAPEALRRTRGGLFQRLERDPAWAAEMLARYRPTHLLLPAASPSPWRGGPWHLVRQTQRWSLWARQADSRPKQRP